jgi:toxin CcdB
MARFDVYENLHPETRVAIPYLLDIQHSLHERLRSRLVIPLSREAREVEGLYPAVTVRGEKLVALVPEMGGISRDQLGKRVGNLSSEASKILNAIDLLITGF